MLIHSVTQMGLEDVTLKEGNQADTEGHTLCDSASGRYLERSNSPRQRVEWWVSREAGSREIRSV